MYCTTVPQCALKVKGQKWLGEGEEEDVHESKTLTLQFEDKESLVETLCPETIQKHWL